MSCYTAIIHCDKCCRVLATINAYHEPRADWFFPQDIISKDLKISSRFCQDCLNGRNKKGANNEDT